jgi:hypothetical protein
MHNRSLSSLDASHDPGILTEITEDAGQIQYSALEDIRPLDLLDARKAGGNRPIYDPAGLPTFSWRLFSNFRARVLIA